MPAPLARSTLAVVLMAGLGCAEGSADEDDLGLRFDGGKDDALAPDATDIPLRPGCVPAPERCDGMDNDCDGFTDEELAPLTCGVGACARTVAACPGGVPGTCTPGTAAPERCDGMDNDCNGKIDDGDPGGGATCPTGMPGACAAGVLHCRMGRVLCEAVTMASPERCDGMDNDCNGMTDEGDPGGGGACTTGEAGACAAGTQHCMGGMLACRRTRGPLPETCDGMDNDCDGMTDEELGRSTCGRGACERTVDNCVMGMAMACVPGMPMAETCNGRDDDCDGTVDNGTAATSCPAAPGVVTAVCAMGGSCEVGPNGCAPGRYDVDRMFHNGCECQDDDAGATCGAATFLGALGPGAAAVTRAGRVPLAGASDWFAVGFPPAFDRAMHGVGTPHITLAGNDDGAYRFEVRTACEAGAMACGAGGAARDLTAWSFTDDRSMAGAMQWSTRSVPWPATVYVRVYRAAAGLSCGQYRLQVTR